MAQAGKYEIPVDIYQHQDTVSEFGDQSDSYTLSYSTRANVIQHTGNRTDSTDEVQYVYRKTITLRSYVPVTEFDHIRLYGKDYRILSIEKDRRKNHQTLEIELIHD